MRTPKEIATDIFNGDIEAKNEVEAMFGKSFENMTHTERRIAVSCISAFDGQWQKKKEREAKCLT
jgi:hypothetical protein